MGLEKQGKGAWVQTTSYPICIYKKAITQPDFYGFYEGSLEHKILPLKNTKKWTFLSRGTSYLL